REGPTVAGMCRRCSMAARSWRHLVSATLVSGAAFALAKSPQPQHHIPDVDFEELAAKCAPEVHPTTLRALVSVESSHNPFAIGVVGGALPRQPTTHAEAIAAATSLQAAGRNFSMGLAQVNLHNMARYGESLDSIFEPCRNLRTGAAILLECYGRAARSTPEQQALLKALSCYYSGNFTTGFDHGYVD